MVMMKTMMMLEVEGGDGGRLCGRSGGHGWLRRRRRGGVVVDVVEMGDDSDGGIEEGGGVGVKRGHYLGLWPEEATVGSPELGKVGSGRAGKGSTLVVVVVG